MNKYSTRIIGAITIFLLFLGIFLSSIDWVAFDLNFYKKEYERLNISQSTGMDQKDLLKVTQGLLDYIKGKRENIKISAFIHGIEREVFNRKEIDHMVDVKDLFGLSVKLKWIFFGVFAGFIVFMIITKKNIMLRELSISYFLALAILVGLGLILLAFIFVDFTGVWDRFHRIFFSNDLWLLDPDTDIMIQMVPEEFFFHMVMKILGLFGSVLTILAIGAGVTLFKDRACKEG